MNKKDWRLGRDQEEYLKGETLMFSQYKSKYSKDDPQYLQDHYHCDFCWMIIKENCLGEEDCASDGYCTSDGRIWICQQCYEDFQYLFEWNVVTDEE